MAVIVQQLVRGMDTQAFEGIADELSEFSSKAPGFQSYSSESTEHGMMITSSWDSELQFRTFFEGIGRPVIGDTLDVRITVSPASESTEATAPS